jgi:hypothetical protein
MKKTYEKPVLSKAGSLSKVTAAQLSLTAEKIPTDD